LIVLSNAAANDVISQAGREAEALGAVGAAVAAGVDAVSSSVDGPAGLFGYAKGGAFQKGVNMFESGAAFSNSVVSNPTLFPMGVMGEAGPEAIMPLTRMNDGSLGVTADIPFNNNSQSNQQLIQEVRELKKEMEKVRIGVEVTATGTNKTFRLLDRVTENGDALNVLAVEGSVTTLSSIQGGQF
jgi:phage-related minor tail protein